MEKITNEIASLQSELSSLNFDGGEGFESPAAVNETPQFMAKQPDTCGKMIISESSPLSFFTSYVPIL